MADVYNFAFARDNVYGHTLALLDRANARGEGIHLDVGCGYGALAEPLVRTLGTTYVGVDLAMDGLEHLAARGFETHQVRIGEDEPSLAALREVVRDRRIVSMTCLDTLEHVPDPRAALRAMRALVPAPNTPLVISVPNTTHVDVASKLLVGRFDYTDTGILDRTHLTFFSDPLIRDMLAETGWAPVAANDVPYASSDQRFPRDHAALADGSLLRDYLTRLRDRVDAFSRTNQLVRLCLRAEALAAPAPAPEASGPFLSVVVPVDGGDQGRLEGLLLALMAQSDQDFEIVLVPVGYEPERRRAIEAIVGDFDPDVARRTRYATAASVAQADLLNAGLAVAEGRYWTTLADAGGVGPDLVADFSRLATRVPGAALHAGGAFDLAGHVRGDGAAPAVVAYPRSLRRDLGERYDPTFGTAAAWGFLVTAARTCGVASLAPAPGPRRIGGSPLAPSARDKATALAVLDAQPALMPAGTLSALAGRA